MSYLTRDERLDRQDLDRGDPDDRVHVNQRSGSNSKITHYHDDAGCRLLTSEQPRTMSRSAA